MLRQVRDWWPWMRHPFRVALVLGLNLLVLVWLAPAFAARLAVLLLVLHVPLTLLTFWRRPWRWRLFREMCQYHIHRSDRVVIYHASRWHSAIELAALTRLCEREMDNLAGRFGRPLPRPLLVVLLRGAGLASRIRGRWCGGFAILSRNAIVIASPSGVSLPEMVRHELAHLFSGRWGPLKPSLNSEGVAVWFQGTEKGVPIDVAALPYFRNRSLWLPAMLKEPFFRDQCREHACYLLAGSFTGFLIRRFGWRAYRRFYRTVANWGCYRWVFRRQFGMTLERAEWHWRNELLVPEALRRRMRNVV